MRASQWDPTIIISRSTWAESSIVPLTFLFIFFAFGLWPFLCLIGCSSFRASLTESCNRPNYLSRLIIKIRKHFSPQHRDSGLTWRISPNKQEIIKHKSAWRLADYNLILNVIKISFEQCLKIEIRSSVRNIQEISYAQDNSSICDRSTPHIIHICVVVSQSFFFKERYRVFMANYKLFYW